MERLSEILYVVALSYSILQILNVVLRKITVTMYELCVIVVSVLVLIYIGFSGHSIYSILFTVGVITIILSILEYKLFNR